jgi:hypothetical protein
VDRAAEGALGIGLPRREPLGVGRDEVRQHQLTDTRGSSHLTGLGRAQVPVLGLVGQFQGGLATEQVDTAGELNETGNVSAIPRSGSA